MYSAHPTRLFHPTRLLDMSLLNVSCNLRKNKKRERDVTQWKFTHMIESWIGNHFHRSTYHLREGDSFNLNNV